jgi:5'-3' exonuclease
MEKKLTLIDATSLIYSACFNTNKNELYSDHFTHYKEALHFYIDNILRETKADEYILFGDERTSYRKSLFPTFKADRKKPYMKFKSDLMHYAINELNFYTHSQLEADDLCLLANRYFKKEYDITIAAKDSDLKQDKGVFFNYGIFRKNEDPTLGFETLDINEANFKLWKAVLTKGHNNKIDYLEKCGDVCATNYLKAFNPPQYKFATLKAFIEGINKNDYTDIKRNISGYGLNKGIEKFNNAFKQTYLFRYEHELHDLGIELDYIELESYIQKYETF